MKPLNITTIKFCGKRKSTHLPCRFSRSSELLTAARHSSSSGMKPLIANHLKQAVLGLKETGCCTENFSALNTIAFSPGTVLKIASLTFDNKLHPSSTLLLSVSRLHGASFDLRLYTVNRGYFERFLHSTLNIFFINCSTDINPTSYLGLNTGPSSFTLNKKLAPLKFLIF